MSMKSNKKNSDTLKGVEPAIFYTSVLIALLHEILHLAVPECKPKLHTKLTCFTTKITCVAS